MMPGLGSCRSITVDRVLDSPVMVLCLNAITDGEGSGSASFCGIPEIRGVDGGWQA